MNPGSATAAGCVGFSIGTETSGSILGPSRTCGVTGLRPTFGRISRYGVMALGCTVGQAVTGVSTLALGSFVTFAAIIVGGFYGLGLLERWILAAE